MNMRLKKALSDIRFYPGRFTLVMLALIIGSWGVGSVLVSYFVLSQDLSANFVNTKPPHAMFISADFKPADLSRLRQNPAIESAEFRDYGIYRIEVKPDEWVPLRLYGATEFEQQSLAYFYEQQGQFHPNKGAMVIERNGLLISDIEIGKPVNIRVGNRSMRIPVEGVIFDPAQPPATQDHFIFAYVDQTTFQQITGEAINQRLILRYRQAQNDADIQKQTDALKSQFMLEGKTIRVSKALQPNSHPHQWQLDSLILMLGSICLLASLMAAILVSQLMNSILAKQIRQIAVLKAVGAKQSHILQIYLLMLLLLGCITALIAVPLAVFSGYGISYGVSMALNFDVLSTSLPWWIYSVLIIFSVGLPIILSLPAIVKASRVCIKAGLDDYGLVQTQAKPMQEIPWANRFSPQFLFALRNTLRQRKRVVVTLLTMALGVAIFSTGFNVRQSLFVMLQQTKASMLYDVKVVLQNSINDSQLRNLFTDLENIRHTETWSGGQGVIQSEMNSAGRGVGITALPFDTQLQASIMLGGRWLSGSSDNELMMNTWAWKAYEKPDIGSMLSITLQGQAHQFKLVGVIEEFDTAKFFIDQSRYQQLANPQAKVNSILFAAKQNDYDAIVKLQQQIEQRVARSDLSVLSVESQAQRVKVIYDHLDIILVSLVMFALLVLIVSALGMASAMGINIMERSREIGVLRAMGATPRKIRSVFVSEALIIAVLSISLGLLIAWPLSASASSFFGNLILGGTPLPFAFSSNGFVITFFTTLGFAWIASYFPAGSATKISTKEALAYE
ncbi:MAG: ABC transporter permease [Gammaproteobacteria bacterium]|nr:ABC transporter permease [Gammaproteobacteria bacterium]